jgi:Ala-tRNA(Pro) deacylase
MAEPQLRQIKKLLDDNKIEYTISEHEPVYTSEQAAQVRGVPLSSGVKSIIIKTEDKPSTHTRMTTEGRPATVRQSVRFFCILVPGDRKIDTKKLRAMLDAKKVSFAKPEEVLERTGCEIGSVHPFGNLMRLPTYMDRKILDSEIVNFNIGLHTHSLSMKSADLLKIVKPKIVELSL